jgi:hypothetical protein
MHTSTSSTSFQNLESAPETLSEEQIARFRRDGYLAFADMFTPEEVEGARTALSELVQELVSGGFEQHRTFWLRPGTRFGIQFEREYTPDVNDPELELKVRKFQWYVDQHPLLQRLESSAAVRGPITSLLGSSPIMFQDMALVKPPYIGREKPWHQDNAYFSVEPLDAVVGVWIALDDATVENGCMHVLAGGHLEGARKHIHDTDCEIPREKIDPSRVVPVELPAGGALIFAGMLPHQTPPNSSSERRRAVQWHYRSAQSTILPREEYDKIYAEYNGMTGEFIPASCAHMRE